MLGLGSRIYFGKLEQALNRLIDLSLMESEIVTLDELKAEILRARDEIKGLIAKLKEEGYGINRTDDFYRKHKSLSEVESLVHG